MNTDQKNEIIWYNIPDYSSYQITKSGQIRSVNRVECVKWKFGGYKRSRKGKPLKHFIDRYGYPCVALQKHSHKHFTVHRLVAITFIPNPKNLPQINHKDGVKTNNHISNLEWCTSSHNVQHAFDNGLKIAPSGIDSYQSKAVLAIKDMAILEFVSQVECAKYIGVSKEAISQAMKNKTKSRGFSIYLL